MADTNINALAKEYEKGYRQGVVDTGYAISAALIDTFGNDLTPGVLAMIKDLTYGGKKKND